jgi:hypothetical protein
MDSSQRDHRLMEEDLARGGHKFITSSGASSSTSSSASLPSRKRSRDRTSPPPRGWRRGDAPWHVNSRRETSELQSPAGPRPFLPATGPGTRGPPRPRPFLPEMGPRPFLSDAVLLGRPVPSAGVARQGPAQGPPARETPRHAPLLPGRIEQPVTNTDLQTNMATQDPQADCPLCNCLTLQKGDQRRCMMFPSCPFNWRVGWTPYW